MHKRLIAVLAGSVAAAGALSGMSGVADAATKTTKVKAKATTKPVVKTVPKTSTVVTSATTAPGAPAGPVTTRAAVPQDNANLEASLKIAYPAGGRTFDPHKDNFVVDKVFTFLLFDRLTQIDNKTFDPVPMLATSWKYSTDFTSLELKLRSDVTFHDGTKFDAVAVKTNIERGKNLADSAVKPRLASIASVEVIDATTVKFNLVKGRGGELPAALATSAGAMISPKALAAGRDIGRAPGDAGSGPYLIGEFDPAKAYVFNRSPHKYWDPRAGKLKRLEIQIIGSTAARLNAVRSGAVDIAHLQLPEAAEGLKLAGRDEIKAYKVGTFLSMHSLHLRAEGKLADPRVRQAISLAIDRVGIAEGLLNGATPEIQPYPKGHWANNPTIEVPRWDPARAEQILKAAGATDVSFKIGYAVGTPFELIAQAVQSQMKDIGITVTLVPKATSTDGNNAFLAKEFDGYQAAITASSDPSVLLSDIWTAGYALINNPASLKTAQDVANRSLDPQMSEDERGTSYRTLWKQLSEELWTVPIARTFQTWGYKGNVQGIEDMGWIWSGVFDARSLWVPK